MLRVDGNRVEAAQWRSWVAEGLGRSFGDTFLVESLSGLVNNYDRCWCERVHGTYVAKCCMHRTNQSDLGSPTRFLGRSARFGYIASLCFM